VYSRHTDGVLHTFTTFGGVGALCEKDITELIVGIELRVPHFYKVAMVYFKKTNGELSFTTLDIEETVEHAKKVGDSYRYKYFKFPFVLDFFLTSTSKQQVWSGKSKWMQDGVSFITGDFMKSSPADNLNKIPIPAEVRHPARST